MSLVFGMPLSQKVPSKALGPRIGTSMPAARICLIAGGATGRIGAHDHSVGVGVAQLADLAGDRLVAVLEIGGAGDLAAERFPGLFEGRSSRPCRRRSRCRGRGMAAGCPCRRGTRRRR